MSNNSKRLPDYTVQLVRETVDQNGEPKTHWFEVGVLWSGKTDVLTGETVYGRLVVKPYTPKSSDE